MVWVPAEVLLRCFMWTACSYRADAGSAPLEVPCLIALVSTAAVSRGNSASVDEGLSQAVLMVMAFEQLTYSDA